MDDVKQRCSRCLLPNSFPGISFNNNGVCNQCLNFKGIEPLGEDLLLKTLKSKKGVKYDCVVGISGGKDSCYVAYLAKEIYKLRTLAVFYESPFYCHLARENVNNVCKKLNLDLEIVNSKNNLEYRLLRNHLISVGATGTTWGQCIFCHYGIDAVLFNIAKEKQIPFNLNGSTRYERWVVENRTKLLLKRVGKLHFKDLLRFIYYQSKAYLFLVDQRRQYRMPCNNSFNVYTRPKKPPNGPIIVKVFDYVQWDHNEIEKTLTEKAGWAKPDAPISWGYDCSLETFLNYTYKKEFGISNVGIYLSNLIRDGRMDRDEAFKVLVENENEELQKEKLESVLEFLEIPQSIRKTFFTRRNNA